MSQESDTSSSTGSDSDLDDVDAAVNSIALGETDTGSTILPGSDDSDGQSLRSPEIVSKNALLSVEKLHNLASNLNDEGAAEGLQACFTDILRFAEAGASGQFFGFEDQDYMKCIVSIFDLPFLHILLNLRRQLLQIASEDADAYRADETVVCWVDFFFACCTDFISSIAGSRQNLRNPRDNLPSGLQKQKEEDGLRVACQLPQTWEHFPRLLQSGHVSPASKRLVLAVLFAVFVIRPDLEVCDPWTATDIAPEFLLECLQTLSDEFITQARELALLVNNSASHTLRTAYAMAIALFASAESAIQRREEESSAPFQPHTSASLLELMHFILLPPSQQLTATLVSEELDDAQAILLHWGSTIPWAWEKWHDPRVIGFDTVVTLTSNWLYHLDKSLTVSLCEESHFQVEEHAPALSTGLAYALKGAVEVDPRASLIALFHQIRDESLRGNVSDLKDEPNMLRLHRTTWCLTELIEGYGNVLASDDLSLVSEQLVALFVELNEPTGEAESKVKGEIIRCLNALKPDITEKALLSFHKNISFFTKIAGVIAKASRMVMSDPSGHFLLTAGVPLGLVTLLDFISLVCKCNAVKCVPVTTFSLLSDLVKFLSLRVGTPVLRIALLNCLVHAHGQCRSSRSGAVTAVGKSATSAGSENNEGSPVVKPHKTWDDEDAYNLALDMVGTNLDLANALASYVSLTIKKTTDPLLVAEVWDYLRDVLLILATGRLEDSDEEISNGDLVSDGAVSMSEAKTLRLTNATEKICTGLEAVLKRSDVVVARLLLDSPLTLSLYDVLQKLTKPAQTEPPDASADADDSLGFQLPNPSAEDAAQFDSRAMKTIEKFLEKLKKIEADLNRERHERPL